MGVALLLLLLSALPAPEPAPTTDRNPPAAEAEEDAGTGGIKSAFGFEACGDWMSTLLVGDADLAFDFDLVGVVRVVASVNLLLVGESKDWDRLRVCRLDCLRGLGLGVASGSVSLVAVAGETRPGRLRLELTEDGRGASKLGVNGGLPYTTLNTPEPRKETQQTFLRRSSGGGLINILDASMTGLFSGCAILPMSASAAPRGRRVSASRLMT